MILACGVTYRRLGVPSLEALVGARRVLRRGDEPRPRARGRHVVVVGAGNSGGQAAVHLARYAARVTIVARGAALSATMSDYLVREIEADDRIDVRTETDVVDGGGDGRLEWLELADRGTGERDRVWRRGLFVLIGTETRTDWLPAASSATTTASCSPASDIDAAGGRSTGHRWRSRPACPACSRPETCAPTA